MSNILLEKLPHLQVLFEQSQTATNTLGLTLDQLDWAFDWGWISIADDYTVLVREGLPKHEDYQFIGEYEGESIRLPSVAESAPDTIYLREHRRLMGFE